MLTTRYPWGATTVLLCALLSQNCQPALNALRKESASQEPPASGVYRQGSSKSLTTLPVPLLNTSPAITPHKKDDLPATPARSRVAAMPSILATVGTSPTAPSTRQPTAIPRASHAVQLRNTPSHAPSPVFTTASGEHVTFGQVDGQWCAAIQAGSGVSTLQRTLPVVGPADIGSFLSWLQGQDVWTSRARVHVLDTSQPSYRSCVYLGKHGLLGGTPSDEEEDSKPPAKRQFPSPDDELAKCSKKARDEERWEQELVRRSALNTLLDMAESEPDKAAEFLEVVLAAVKDKNLRQKALGALGKVAQAAPDMVSDCLPSLRAAAKDVDRDVRLTALRTLGEAEWKHYFGDVGSAPDLPSDMGAILDSPCPFWPEEKVKDTHLLALIPTTVGDKPFSLDLLGELIQHPKNGGHRTEYKHYSGGIKAQLGKESPNRSYWLLMTRDVLEDSRDKEYAAQKELVAGHAIKQGTPYELPRVLEATTAISMHHAREGERLFGDDPWTYTRCQEVVGVVNAEFPYPIIVGGFESSGLHVGSSSYGNPYYGVACCRKL